MTQMLRNADFRRFLSYRFKLNYIKNGVKIIKLHTIFYAHTVCTWRIFYLRKSALAKPSVSSACHQFNLQNQVTIQIKFFGFIDFYVGEISHSYKLFCRDQYLIINLWRIELGSANEITSLLSIK
jgi:hypothetical protein